MLSFDHPFLSFIFNSLSLILSRTTQVSLMKTNPSLPRIPVFTAFPCHSQILCPLQCTCCLYAFSKAVPSVSLRLSPTAVSRYLCYPRTSGCCPFLFSEAVWVSMSTRHPTCLPGPLRPLSQALPSLCAPSSRSHPPWPQGSPQLPQAPRSHTWARPARQPPAGLSRGGLICTAHSGCPRRTRLLPPLAFKSVLATSWCQILTLGTWEFLPPSACFL